MHQTLCVPEILLNIFGYIKHNTDLAALARTCKVFQEPALDVLWKELYDITPLVRCLPEACHFTHSKCNIICFRAKLCHTFSRPLIEAEWKTLRAYTRRVRIIHNFSPFSPCTNEDKVREMLSLAPFDEPLFPHLQSLRLLRAPAVPPEHVAVTPLTTLHLKLQFQPLPDKKFFNAFGDRCPNMEKLLIYMSSIQACDYIDSTVSRLVCRWPNLQEVVCLHVDLDMDAISHLSSVPNLKRLWCTTTKAGLIQDLGSMLVFSNLTELVIRSRHLDALGSLLRYIRLPMIETLSIFTSKFNSGRIEAFWSALQGACPHVLTSFEFCGFDREDDHWDPLDADEFQLLALQDLRPCTAFGDLRELSIDFDCPMSLTDADMLELASPQTQKLVINDTWGWQLDVDDGGITLNGLLGLLRQRPSLNHLCLAIDTRTFTEIPEGLDVSFPRRELKINFADSCILPEFVPALVSVFSALRLNHSTLEVWGIEGGREIAEESQALWGNVLNGLSITSQEQSSASKT